MQNKHGIKWLMLLCCLGLLLLLLVWKVCCPSRLGVYIQENKLPATAETLALPEDFSILLNGGTAPYVAAENAYYVPLNLADPKWAGNLAASGYRLTFLPDPLWGDPAAAMAQAHPFALVISRGGEYTLRSVVFTGMAVLAVDLPAFDFEDKSDTVYTGSLVLQDPGSENSDAEMTACGVKLHAHGGSTRGFEKKSYKLTLTDGAGENLSLPLGGMRSDDDWILNSLYADPNRIRDQLSLTLWNEVAATSSANFAGVQSRYAELIVNGQYRGIYLLEERLDGKTVNARPGDTLYKAAEWVWPDPAALQTAASDEEIDGWSIRYPKAGGSWQPLAVLTETVKNESTYEQFFSLLNVDNYVDMMLYRELICGVDNGPKNMYYYAQQTWNGLRVYLLPWDLNLTFGYNLAENAVQSGYYDDQVTLLLEDMGDSLPDSARTAEYEAKLADRWQQLRRNVFSEERLLSRVDALHAQLVNSGAMNRDAATWIHGYVTDDTAEIKGFITRRLAFLDEHYAALLG